MILLSDAIGGFSWIELAWTATAIVALYIGWLNRLEAHRDLKAIAGLRNGRWRIAKGNIRREWIRAIITGAYLVIGLLAGTKPAIPDPTVISLIGSVGLTVTSILLALNSYLDRRDRLYLLHYRSTDVSETQDQREDREFGEARRTLEAEHNKDS